MGPEWVRVQMCIPVTMDICTNFCDLKGLGTQTPQYVQKCTFTFVICPINILNLHPYFAQVLYYSGKIIHFVP